MFCVLLQVWQSVRCATRSSSADGTETGTSTLFTWNSRSLSVHSAPTATPRRFIWRDTSRESTDSTSIRMNLLALTLRALSDVMSDVISAEWRHQHVLSVTLLSGRGTEFKTPCFLILIKLSKRTMRYANMLPRDVIATCITISMFLSVRESIQNLRTDYTLFLCSFAL